MNFSENLKNARKSAGLSQEQFAETLGVSRQTISKWESGESLPETAKLPDISRILGVSTDYLFSGIKPDEQPKPATAAVTPAEFIFIKTHDGNNILKCTRVSSSKIVLPSKKEPKYILNGVTGNGIFGDLIEEILAFYADEESIKKEIDEIYTTMINGGSTYELKYFAPVIMKGLSPRLAESTDIK